MKENQSRRKKDRMNVISSFERAQKLLSGFRQIKEELATLDSSQRSAAPMATVEINYDLNARRCRLVADLPIKLTFVPDLGSDLITVESFLPGDNLVEE